MNKTILISIGLICALVAAAGIMHYNDIYRKAEELNIYEMLLHDQFKDNASPLGTYCIEIAGKNPSDEFLARFKDHQPPVKKGSEFILGQDLKFSVYNFRWLNNWTVEVCGDCFRDSDCGSGRTYLIIRKAGCWNIEKILALWIS